MKEFRCDICKRETGEYDLSTLYEKYAPEGIKDICKDCDKELTEVKGAMNIAVDGLRDNWIRKIIKKMIK